MPDTTPARPDEVRSQPPEPADWSTASDEQVREHRDWFVEALTGVADRLQHRCEDSTHAVEEVRQMATAVGQWSEAEIRAAFTELRPPPCAPSDGTERAVMKPEWINVKAVGISDELLADIAEATQRARAVVPAVRTATEEARRLLREVEENLRPHQLPGEV